MTSLHGTSAQSLPIVAEGCGCWSYHLHTGHMTVPSSLFATNLLKLSAYDQGYYISLLYLLLQRHFGCEKINVLNYFFNFFHRKQLKIITTGLIKLFESHRCFHEYGSSHKKILYSYYNWCLWIAPWHPHQCCVSHNVGGLFLPRRYAMTTGRRACRWQHSQRGRPFIYSLFLYTFFYQHYVNSKMATVYLDWNGTRLLQ